MCQCGCGDFDGVRWAVTIGDRVLAVSDYDGCNNGCDAPLGFTLHLMTKRSAKKWHIEVDGDWRVAGTDANDFDDHYLNLFSQNELAKAAGEIEAREGLDLSDYDSLADLLQDCGLDIMRRAWELTRAEEKRLGAKHPGAK